MVEIAVGHWQIKGFAKIANVNVSQMNCEKLHIALKNSVFFLILAFTCSVDGDCHQGYCEDKKCVCLDGYAYSEDCSFEGCEYERFHLSFLAVA